LFEELDIGAFKSNMHADMLIGTISTVCAT